MEARALYARHEYAEIPRHGYAEIPAYKSDPFAEHFFEKALV